MPISSAGRASNRTRGVTLIEMMVVVAIIAVVAGISLPSVTSGIDSVRLATASQSIATFLNSAVNRAERRQKPVELVILPRENRLTMYSDEPRYERDLKMPEG